MTEQKHEPLSAAELDAIAERCKRALPGPWRWRVDDASLMTLEMDETHSVLIVTRCKTCQDKDPAAFPCFWPVSENADFIAHAREDVARLLADLRTARELADQWQSLARQEREISEVDS